MQDLLKEKQVKNGITANPLTHKEVQETADRVAPLFKKLVTECIKNIDKAV